MNIGIVFTAIFQAIRVEVVEEQGAAIAGYKRFHGVAGIAQDLNRLGIAKVGSYRWRRFCYGSGIVARTTSTTTRWQQDRGAEDGCQKR
jgi:hypothetical protein